MRPPRRRTTATLVLGLVVAAASLTAPVQSAPATNGGAAPADPAPAANVPGGEAEDLGPPLPQRALSPDQALGEGENGEPLAFFLPRGNDDVASEFTVVDVRTQEVVFRQKVPSGNDSWGVEYSPAEQAVYLGMRSGELYRYQIGGDTIEELGTPMPGEQILMLEAAPDGTIFGGTYPNGKVFSYDPESGDVRDYGQVLGQPYVRSIAATEDTLWVGTRGEAHLAEIDRATGELTEIPLPAQYRDRLAVYDLFHVRDDRLLVRTESPPEHEIHVFDLDSREFVDTVEEGAPRMVSPADPTTGTHVYFRVNEGEHSGQIVRYDLDSLTWEPTGWAPNVGPGDFRWIDMDDPDFPGLSLAVTHFYGHIYVYNFESGNGTYQKADMHAPPARLASLDRGPDGKIYISGQPGMARWDPADDAMEPLSGSGGAQGFGSWGDDLLIGKYPGGGLRVYDTAAPWNPGAGNPTGSMPIGAEQDRPFAFAELPERVAVGSAPESGMLGGALTLWNPDTGDTEVFRDVVADQSVVSLAYDGDLVWGGTSITGGFGAEPTASEAVLFAFDPRSREVVFRTAPVAGAEAVSGLTVHAGKVWGIADGTLFAIDLDTRDVAGTIDLGHDTTEPHGRDFEIVVDDAGRMFASSTKKLHYIDRARWQAHVLADNAVEDLALDDHGDLYYRSGARLFRFSPSPATGPECDRIVDGHHDGPLEVNDGVTCVDGAAVSGRVEVSAGAGLVVTGGELSGGLTARGASTVRLYGADVAGEVGIHASTGPVVVTGSTISGAVSLTGNVGGENVISATTINGTLTCTGNQPPPTDNGAPTTATGGARGQCAPDDSPEIEVLSSRPDVVSGGDALIRVSAPTGGSPDEIDVTVDGVDVTDELRADHPSGALEGVVSGLPEGTSTVTATAGDGTPAELALVNHPITGPIFSGPHEEPFICDTARFELVTGELLGEPLDDDCSAGTRVDYVYRSTGRRWTPLPGGETRPDDLAWTTTSTGAEVPYIVRVETGTINRAIYETAVLHDPATAEPAPSARPAGWNGRLVYRFGGGCPRGWYVQGDETGGVLDGGMLEQGYAVASSSLNVFGNNCNDVLAAETMSMVKERFIEAYGPPESTLGWGSSGGAYQVHQIGDNYPGLLDGIIAGASFPDVTSATLVTSTDAGLLHRYFNQTAGALTREQQRAIAGFGKWESIARGAGSARRIDPRDQCPGQLPAELRYDPDTNPGGARCDVYSHHANVYGVDDDTGVVARPLDNVGVQYGLGALEDGVIGVDEFLDLNAGIGGLDADADHVPQRTEADTEALATAYRTGRILNGGGGLAGIPIIDFRLYFDDRPNGDNHQRFHSFSTRERLLAANGTAANHVMLVDELDHGGFNSRAPIARRALAELDAWVSAIRADDAPADEPIDRVARNRPGWLEDSCWTRGDDPQRIRETQQPGIEGSTCAEQYPVWSSPRIVAGGPLANDVVKCRLEPVDAGDYAVEFAAEQLERAREIFPDGVCDWSEPGVGQQGLAGTWLRF